MTPQEKDRIMKIMPELKAYRTINEIAEVASHFLDKVKQYFQMWKVTR